MRISILFFVVIIFSACSISDRGVRIDFPNPKVDVCLNQVSNDELLEIRSKVDSETFADDKLKRAKYHSRERCFVSSQVIFLLDAFTFADDKLELAKFLYTKTDDKRNYDSVIDVFTFQSDKDELREYIDSI